MTNSIEDKNLCTGCASCYYTCPRQAIVMKRNEKGFIEPIVSPDKCIQCGLCLKVCHLVSEDSLFREPLAILAAKNKSDQERLNSSSGGVFPLLARNVLTEGGIVYGATLDASHTVRHVRAETMDEALKCCQSKYVQSELVKAFGQMIEDAKSKKTILFTGTSCQIAALHSFFKMHRISEEHILFVDFICHGTPSPYVFRDFLKMIEENYEGTLRDFYFRNKDQGWGGNGYKAVFLDRSPVVNGFYLRGFNKLFSLSTNEACFHCRYSKPKRISDITLGDFWGIEKTPISDFRDNLGVSAVLINTEKGKTWFAGIRDSIEVREAQLDYCKYNMPLFHSPEENCADKEFWDTYLNQGYVRAFNLYCKFTGWKGLYERFKWLVMYKLNMKDKILSVNARIQGHQ